MLFVDDREQARRAIGSVLHDTGFQVLTAASVALGKLHLDHRAVDAVVADLRLGLGMPDGAELLAWAERHHPSVRRFLLTADPVGQELARAVGAIWIDRDNDPPELLVTRLRQSLGIA